MATKNASGLPKFSLKPLGGTFTVSENTVLIYEGLLRPQNAFGLGTLSKLTKIIPASQGRFTPSGNLMIENRLS